MQLLLADLEQNITRFGLRTVMWAAIILIGSTLLAVLLKKSSG